MNKSMPQEIQQVLKGLTLNRRPGWHFPGNFLEVFFDDVGAEGSRLTIDPGPHCINADGQTSMAAVALLADIGMSTAIRKHTDHAARMATIAMTLQFTGAPCVGFLEAKGRFDGFSQGTSGRQGLACGEVYADGQLLCSSSGSFLILGKIEGMHPLSGQHVAVETPLLSVDELTEQEQAVYQRACDALQPGPGSFIERFWMGSPQQQEGGAFCEFTNGMHVGNRAGHTQGGITLALAMQTADAALGDQWSLVSLSSWYIRPGTGPMLRAQAEIIHQGGLTAVIQVRVLDEKGGTVLMTMSSHSRLAKP